MKHLPYVLLFIALIAILPLAAGAQEEHDHSQMMAESEAETPAEDAQVPACCQEKMMRMHQEMQEHMKAKDAELARLAEEMKSATGDTKVDAIAAALEELIDQHRSMHQMRMAHGSMPGMMMRMHQHMRTRGSGMDMSNCPMMQEMEGDEDSEESTDDEAHDEHHSP